MKHFVPKLLAVAVLLMLTVGIQRTAKANDDDDFDSDQSRIQIGFKLNPVPLNLAHKNHAKVGLGSYLVNAVGGCNDCHTNPAYLPTGDPFHGLPKQVNAAHYLAGGQAFGPFISRNLTPEGPQGLPAGLTLTQFKLVLRTGVDLDHVHPQISPLLQVMPWPTFQSMSDHDIEAIYEYLSAIPPATPGP